MCLHEIVDVLARLESADEEHVPLRYPVRLQPFIGRRGGGRPCFVDAERGDDDALAIGAVHLDEVVSRGVRRGDDDPRALECARHQLLVGERRAIDRLGVQDEPDVVHGDDTSSPPCRRQHEVGSVEDVDVSAEQLDRREVAVTPRRSEQSGRRASRMYVEPGRLDVAKLLLAAPGESRQDDVDIGLFGKRRGELCDVVADTGTGAEEGGGVQRDSHPRMLSHGRVRCCQTGCRAAVTYHGTPTNAAERLGPDAPSTREVSSPAVTQMAEMWRYRGLIGNFASRELKSKYKHSVLGWTWSLINPAATLADLHASSSRRSSARRRPRLHNGMTTLRHLPVHRRWSRGTSSAMW